MEYGGEFGETLISSSNTGVLCRIFILIQIAVASRSIGYD